MPQGSNLLSLGGHQRLGPSAGDSSRPVEWGAGGQRSSTPDYCCDSEFCAPRIPLTRQGLSVSAAAVVSVTSTPTLPTYCVPVRATRRQRAPSRLSFTLMGPQNQLTGAPGLVHQMPGEDTASLPHFPSPQALVHKAT